MAGDRPTVFCKDCKFRPRWGFASFSDCKHPAAVELDTQYLATAKPNRKSCSSMRLHTQKCGPDGKLWEPRK